MVVAKNKASILLATACALCSVGCSGEPASLPEAARELMDCVENSDAACVDRYVSAEERAALGIDKPKLSRWLKEYVAPTLKKLKHSGEPRTRTRPGFGMIRDQPVLHADGRKISLVVRVARTADGIRSPRIVSGLTMLIGQVKYGPVPIEGAAPDAYWQALAKAAKTDGSTLSRMGIAGLYDDRERRFRRWEEWHTHCLQRAAAAMQRQREERDGAPSATR